MKKESLRSQWTQKVGSCVKVHHSLRLLCLANESYHTILYRDVQSRQAVDCGGHSAGLVGDIYYDGVVDLSVYLLL